MNLKYIYRCLDDLQRALNGKVSLELYEFSGLVVRVFWMYKMSAIRWQYVISQEGLELVNDNSAFILFLIEKAQAEYTMRTTEIDDDRA